MYSIRNVVVGVSGGVDSAVATLLLKNKGFNVLGVFMKNWDLTDENGSCTISEDLEDAKYVCEKLKVSFLEVDFVKKYWNDVFVGFTEDYQKGLTPNPDIMCNKYIKFKAFFEHAIKNLKADAIATGHYARTSFGNFLEKYESGAKVKLLKANDHLKDQTFFLSQVSQNSLRKTMFPLGDLTKDEVKKIALENGLEKIAKKPESVGICFIGYRRFQKFMSEYVAPKPGRFIDMTGKVVGTHDGVHLYTLGQRSGLGGRNGPWYIVKKFPHTSDILVSPGVNHPIQFSSMFFTEKPHWIANPPDLTYKDEVNFRFQHTRSLAKCDLFQCKTGELFGNLKKPLRALTPGQYAVFYKEDECLGSAKITEIGPSEFSLGKNIPKDYKEYLEDEVCAVSSH